MEPVIDWGKQQGMTLEMLANYIGVKPSAFSMYCNGKRTPNPRIVRNIYDKTGITPDRLYGIKTH